MLVHILDVRRDGGPKVTVYTVYIGRCYMQREVRVQSRFLITDMRLILVCMRGRIYVHANARSLVTWEFYLSVVPMCCAHGVSKCNFL